MRRLAILSAVAALLGLGIGCKNTSGRCDCNYNPANEVLPATGMTYPVVGPPLGGPVPTSAVPSAMPATTPMTRDEK